MYLKKLLYLIFYLYYYNSRVILFVNRGCQLYVFIRGIGYPRHTTKRIRAAFETSILRKPLATTYINKFYYSNIAGNITASALIFKKLNALPSMTYTCLLKASIWIARVKRYYIFQTLEDMCIRKCILGFIDQLS